MKKRLSTSILSLCLAWICGTLSVIAQPQSVGTPEPLVKSSGTEFMNPLWSPDGERIAFTSPQFRGIWVADASGQNVRQITDEAAGYGYSWSSDGTSLLTRVSSFENKRRKLAIKIYHTSGKEPTQLTEFRDDMPSVPVWANYDQQVVLIANGDIETFESQKEVSAAYKSTVGQSFYVLKQDQIAKGKTPENSTEDISPFEDATYLNLEVSPDGRKLAFEVYGGNLYVMNIDGTQLMDLGRANRPSWSPDSRYVVAMVAEDNGHDMTRSDLYALSIDGQERINLTASTDLIAMNPDWSPKGDRIAFDTPQDGTIYQLNIAFK